MSTTALNPLLSSSNASLKLGEEPLLLGWSPLFEADEMETVRQQAVHITRNGAMVFHDTRRDPLGDTSTLTDILILPSNIGITFLPSHAAW